MSSYLRTSSTIITVLVVGFDTYSTFLAVLIRRTIFGWTYVTYITVFIISSNEKRANGTEFVSFF